MECLSVVLQKHPSKNPAPLLQATFYSKVHNYVNTFIVA